MLVLPFETLRLQLAKHWQKFLAQSLPMFCVEVCQQALEIWFWKSFLLWLYLSVMVPHCCRFGNPDLALGMLWDFTPLLLFPLGCWFLGVWPWWYWDAQHVEFKFYCWLSRGWSDWVSLEACPCNLASQMASVMLMLNVQENVHQGKFFGSGGSSFVRGGWKSWTQEVHVPFSEKRKRCWIPGLLKRSGLSSRQLEMEQGERTGNGLKWVWIMNLQAPEGITWVCHIKEKVRKCVMAMLITKWLRIKEKCSGKWKKGSSSAND